MEGAHSSILFPFLSILSCALQIVIDNVVSPDVHGMAPSNGCSSLESFCPDLDTHFVTVSPPGAVSRLKEVGGLNQLLALHPGSVTDFPSPSELPCLHSVTIRYFPTGPTIFTLFGYVAPTAAVDGRFTAGLPPADKSMTTMFGSSAGVEPDTGSANRKLAKTEDAFVGVEDEVNCTLKRNGFPLLDSNGVPEISPVAGLKVMPAGKLPDSVRVTFPSDPTARPVS
jgi:hypothetical protein